MTSLVQPRLEVALREPSEGPRRALNILVAAIGLLLTAPLMAAIAAAIKLTSRGPVFYTQTRIGIDRREPGVPAGNSRRTNDYGGEPVPGFKVCTKRAPPKTER